MYFISTRGGEKVTGAQAIVKGLAHNGGLYVPEEFPKVTGEEMEKLLEMSYPERAAFVLGKYLAEELGTDFLKEVCEKAYSSFEGNDPVPLVKIDGELYILELFHGPTCAFKDMALTVLPYLLKKSCEVTGVKEDILILAATSGDTGKAALEGFRDVPGTKVAVFYPDEGVAKMQRLQMCIQDGDNVFVSAVKGNFDDCQRAVKNLFASEDFNAKLAEKNTRLSSANSINFGRLAPQIAYYFSAYCDLITSSQIEMGDKVDFVVPTGNFGDILAGWYAKQMGLPINMMICATNENSSVWDLFTKGDYNTATPVEQPKYLECFLFARLGRDAVLRYLETSEKKRIFRVGEQELETLCDNVFCSVVSENRVESIISGMYRANGYVIDPSTAVAYGGLQDYRANGGLHRDTLLLAKHRPALEKE